MHCACLANDKMTRTGVSMKCLVRALITCLLATVVNIAYAHSDEYLDTVKAPHGGQMRMSGAYHLELVLKDNEITVYLSDHSGNDVSAAGATGTAIVHSGKDRVTVKLSPSGESALQGHGNFILDPKMTVSVKVKLKEKDHAEAKFQPLKKASAH